MADFAFFSDSDEDKAVEAILSQAQDQIVLEQVAAINCSGFTDSSLPTHLETRFQKLKSFPVSNPKSSIRSVSDLDAKSVKTNGLSASKSVKDESFLPTKKTPGGEMGNESNSEANSVGKMGPIHSKSVEGDIFSPVKKNPERKTAKGSKSSRGSSSRWDSSTESNSPPQKSGCFWCSPKKSSKKKSGKENNFLGVNFDWEKDDDLLADLEAFSVEGQKRLSKKAMKEEERMNREAEKIVKWAKQVSARMDVSGIEDELSDDDHFK